MGAIVEINTDGLAKLGETICYSLGLTAFGRKQDGQRRILRRNKAS